MAARLASRLERSEATITTLRGEKLALREQVADRDRAEDRAVAAERQIEELREQLALLRARPPIVRSAEREAVELAELEQAGAERRAQEAEVRAARAQRELRETVALVTGQARQLTADEVQRLQGDGPAGPAMLARAIDGVVRARRTGNPTEVKRALRTLSEASETYRARL
jgi:DNA repair exonuclease SbcCD ATPase subunit